MIQKILFSFLLVLISIACYSQDLSEGYIANDLDAHPMQDVDKPEYLSSIVDPSFPSTAIRRISDAGNGNVIAPMYNTIQAWNADESLMIVYSSGDHQLLNGVDYSYIRNLSDINPADIELIFWHFNNPDVLFYFENGTDNFIEYTVSTQSKTIIVNLATETGCTENVALGNDVQMMSWDSDIISFRCGNSEAYFYKISTASLTSFYISDIGYTAPMPFPSGELFYHQGNVYNDSGEYVRSLNLDVIGEHSCLGKLSNGDDAYFAIAFEEAPSGECQGTLVAHNATTGNCFSVTSYADYGYPQSGTHISSLAHKNTEGGWVAVSMMGFDLDGQELLDQELIIAKVNEGSADVYRVAHHRSDEEEIDYFGEPHVTISPTGTRLLFGSDWSGSEDGLSVDSYVAELASYQIISSSNHPDQYTDKIVLYPNPTNNTIHITGIGEKKDIVILDVNNFVCQKIKNFSANKIDISHLSAGVYFVQLFNATNGTVTTKKVIKTN